MHLAPDRPAASFAQLPKPFLFTFWRRSNPCPRGSRSSRRRSRSCWPRRPRRLWWRRRQRRPQASRRQRRAGRAAPEGRHPDALDDAELAPAEGGPAEDGRALHGQDGREGRRAGGRLGRPVRPHPQRRRLRRRPGHHAGRHDPGAVLRRARRLHGPRATASRRSAARARTPRASGTRPRSRARTGTWAVPWFTEARSIYYRKDVLEKAGVDPATAFTDLDSFKATLQAIKDKVPDIEPFGAPGKKAYDLVHQVMPFVWDNGGAELSDGRQAVHDQLARGPAGRGVHGRPDHGRAVRQEPARARRHAGREPVQGRPARGLDRRPVGARLDRPRRGRHLEQGGARERRRRADADRSGAARRTRSWAART